MFITGRKTQASNAQRGDTLVEVLISIAVASLILGGAYATSNHSLQSTRAAQERSIALKLAESQLEQLKTLVASNPQAVFGGGGVAAPNKFCINNLTVYDALIAPGNANCTVNVSGAASTNQPTFTLITTRTGNDFSTDETWTDVSGSVIDQLQLNYRVYQ